MEALVYIPILAVALWCGQPVNSTKGSLGLKTGTDITATEIQKCRTDLLACLDKKSTKVDCFKEQKQLGN